MLALSLPSEVFFRAMWKQVQRNYLSVVFFTGKMYYLKFTVLPSVAKVHVGFVFEVRGFLQGLVDVG